MFLVVGSNGQLGNELKLLLQDKAVYVDKDELDITDKQAVQNFVNGKNFEAIINCAAYTAVDKAESDEKLATLINVDGPRNLAETGVPLIHISTDYVFDGTNSKPYTEEDKPHPQTVYGRTKLASEQAVMKAAETAIVIRTAWLYSTFGNNFVKTMRRLGAERKSLNVVFDQVGTPTYAADLANAIVTILPQMKKGMKEIYHFSNEGVCSWYDVALAVMAQSDLDYEVMPIESKEYPTPAQRPHYSVLNKAKIKRDFGLKINNWAVSLAECVEKMNNGL